MRDPVVESFPRLERKVAAVRVGTLDDPSAAPPDVAIFVADKPAWAPVPKGIPTFDQFYTPAEFWPPEVMARVKAVMER